MPLTAKMREHCERAGMPAGLADEKQREWYDANEDKVMEAIRSGGKPPEKKEPEKKPETTSVAGRFESDPDAVRKAIEAIEKQRKDLKKLIRERSSAAGLTDDQRTTIMDDASDETEALRMILDKQAENQRAAMGGTPDGKGGTQPANFWPKVQQTGDGGSRLREAIGSSFVMRCLGDLGVRKESIEKAFPVAERKDGWDDKRFRFMPAIELGKKMLESRGYDCEGVAPDVLARAIMGSPGDIAMLGNADRIRYDGGGHTTGQFANITLDAMNKTLLVGYNEREFTWRQVFKQGPSARDFKNLHRIRIGDVTMPVIWPEGSEMDEASTTDQKVSYCVESYGQVIRFGWQALVNDDMSAFSVIPRRQGEAFARLVNKTAWTQITSNPTMSYDSIALFSNASGARKQDNLDSGAISETTLGTARKLLRLMKGLNTRQGNESEQILDLEAMFLVVPAALETLARRYLNSEYLADASLFQVVNQFKSMKLVVEPELDAASAADYYVFANPNQIDNVEVTFLQGYESPVARQFVDNETWSLSYQMAQVFAAKPIDHRGMIMFDN